MQNTDDEAGWIDLLKSLDDDELERYGEIVADQRRLEWRHRWAQVTCLVVAVLLFALAVREVMVDGITYASGGLLALGLAFAYWPYRKALVRRLWSRHKSAVARETAARAAQKRQ